MVTAVEVVRLNEAVEWYRVRLVAGPPGAHHVVAQTVPFHTLRHAETVKAELVAQLGLEVAS
jgi:hypothetical protein